MIYRSLRTGIRPCPVRNRVSFRPVVFPSFHFQFPAGCRAAERQFPGSGLLASLDEPSFRHHFPVHFPDITVCRGGVRINGLPTECLDTQLFDEYFQHLLPALVQVPALGAEGVEKDTPDSHVMSLVVIREFFLLRHRRKCQYVGTGRSFLVPESSR